MENEEYLKKLQALFDEAKKKMEQPCPSCGHCPTCGHSPYRAYPMYPYYPHQPFITWGTGYVYTAGSAIQGNTSTWTMNG